MSKVSAPTWIQAIPLYTTEDDEAFEYFRGHQKDIDALLGNVITLMLPETVLEGAGKDVYTAPLSKRYPTLRPTDLPCLWIEDGAGYKFALPLPAEKNNIVKLMRKLKEAATNATDAKSLQAAFNEEQKEDGEPLTIPVMRRLYLQAAGWTFAAVVLLLVLVLWLVPSIAEYQLGAPVFLIYLIASLIPALVLFGAMRSYGTIKGRKFGIFAEFGGPAAVSVFVLLAGLYYERTLPARNFAFSVYFYEGTDQGNIVSKDGTLTLILDRQDGWSINSGEALPRDIPSKWLNQTVHFKVKMDGYEIATPSKGEVIAPSRRIYIQVKKTTEKLLDSPASVPATTSVMAPVAKPPPKPESEAKSAPKTAELHLDAVSFDRQFGDRYFDVVVRNTGESIAVATTAEITFSDVKRVTYGPGDPRHQAGSMGPSGDYSGIITADANPISVPIAQTVEAKLGGSADRFRIFVIFDREPSFSVMNGTASVVLRYNGGQTTEARTTSFSLPAFDAGPKRLVSPKLQ